MATWHSAEMRHDNRLAMGEAYDFPEQQTDIDAMCPVCECSHYETITSDDDLPKTALLACPTCGQWWADMDTYY